MNITLTEKEIGFLKAFASKQYDGAKDNVGTVTPIHVVERIRKQFVEDSLGDMIAIKYPEPVAFFFTLDEAKRYVNDYQKHNCGDCRIYTYGLGYSNQGDMPVFRGLLLRMGQELLEGDEEMTN